MKSMSWTNEGQGRKSWYIRFQLSVFSTTVYSSVFPAESTHKIQTFCFQPIRKHKFNHKKDIHIHSNRHIWVIIWIYIAPYWAYIATMLNIYSHHDRYICPPNCSIPSSQDIVFIPGADLPYAPGILNSPHSSEALIPRDRASKPWGQSLWTVGAEPVFFLNITFFFRRNRKAESKTR